MNFEIENRYRDLRHSIISILNEEDMFHQSSEVMDKNSIMECMKKLSDSGYINACLNRGADSVAVREELASVNPSLFLSCGMTFSVYGALLGALKNNVPLNMLQNGDLIGSVVILTHDVIIESSGKEVNISGKSPHVINAHISESYAVPLNIEDSYFILSVPADEQTIEIGPSLNIPGYGRGLIADISIRGYIKEEQELMESQVDFDPVMHTGLLMDELYSISALGIIKGSLMSAIRWAKTGKRKGLRLIDTQEYGFSIAEMFTLYESARVMCYRMTWSGKENEKDYPVLNRCSKVFCCENAEKVSSMAIQIMGRDGIGEQNLVLRNYLCSKYLQVVGTSTEHGRIQIADMMLDI